MKSSICKWLEPQKELGKGHAGKGLMRIQDYSNNKLEGYSSVCMCSSPEGKCKEAGPSQGRAYTIAATFEHVCCIKFTLWERLFHSPLCPRHLRMVQMASLKSCP